MLVFGDSIFLGQHNTCTSSLLKPRAVSERHVLFEAYRQPLPAGFFGNQYLDSISSIDDAAGYFAVVGMESSFFANQVSASENSFQQMLTSMHSYTEEAKKAQLETVAVKQEIAEIQQQMEAENRFEQNWRPPALKSWPPSANCRNKRSPTANMSSRWRGS